MGSTDTRFHFAAPGALLAALWLSTAFAVALSPPSFGAETAAASVAEAESDLGERALARFRADALRDGVLLRPLQESSALRSIELVDDGEVLVNGKEFAQEELEAFLGADGALVAALARMDAVDRRLALGLPAGESRLRAAEGEEEVTVEVGSGAPRVRVRASREDRVSVGSSIRLEPGETARDVVCIGCSVELLGEAFGDAVAIGGHLDVQGIVHGNAAAIGGGLEVGEEGQVLGDGVSVGGSVDVAPGGQILGQRSAVGFGPGWFGDWDGDWGWAPFGVFSNLPGIFWAIFRVGLLALLVGLCLLVARPSVEAAGRRIEGEPWKALFAGLLTQLLFFPVLVIVTLVLAVSIIGIPLLVLVPVAILVLIFGALVGFSAVASVVGRAVERRFGARLAGRFLVAVVGVVAIQAISLIGRLLGLPGGVLGFIGLTVLALGFCVKYVAWTLGLGAMTLVALGRDWRQPPPAAARVEREPAPSAAPSDDEARTEPPPSAPE